MEEKISFTEDRTKDFDTLSQHDIMIGEAYESSLYPDISDLTGDNRHDNTRPPRYQDVIGTTITTNPIDNTAFLDHLVWTLLCHHRDITFKQLSTKKSSVAYDIITTPIAILIGVSSILLYDQPSRDFVTKYWLPEGTDASLAMQIIFALSGMFSNLGVTTYTGIELFKNIKQRIPHFDELPQAIQDHLLNNYQNAPLHHKNYFLATIALVSFAWGFGAALPFADLSEDTDFFGVTIPERVVFWLTQVSNWVINTFSINSLSQSMINSLHQSGLYSTISERQYYTLINAFEKGWRASIAQAIDNPVYERGCRACQYTPQLTDEMMQVLLDADIEKVELLHLARSLPDPKADWLAFNPYPWPIRILQVGSFIVAGFSLDGYAYVLHNNYFIQQKGLNELFSGVLTTICMSPIIALSFAFALNVAPDLYQAYKTPHPSVRRYWATATTLRLTSFLVSLASWGTAVKATLLMTDDPRLQWFLGTLSAVGTGILFNFVGNWLLSDTALIAMGNFMTSNMSEDKTREHMALRFYDQFAIQFIKNLREALTPHQFLLFITTKQDGCYKIRDELRRFFSTPGQNPDEIVSAYFSAIPIMHGNDLFYRVQKSLNARLGDNVKRFFRHLSCAEKKKHRGDIEMGVTSTEENSYVSDAEFHAKPQVVEQPQGPGFFARARAQLSSLNCCKRRSYQKLHRHSENNSFDSDHDNNADEREETQMSCVIL